MPNNEGKTVGRVAPTRRQLELEGLQTLQKLLDHLQLKTWDTLIIGDGSGGGWDIGAGWAGVLIDYYSRAAKCFFGAMNTGTVTVGEIMPYLHAMAWYTAKDNPGRRRRKEVTALGRKMQIHVVTDSEVVANAGNIPERRHSHAELWAAFDAYAALGYQFTFHHVPRGVVNLNILVDEISRQARVAMSDVFAASVTALQKRYPGLPADVTVYDFF